MLLRDAHPEEQSEGFLQLVKVPQYILLVLLLFSFNLSQKTDVFAPGPLQPNVLNNLLLINIRSVLSQLELGKDFVLFCNHVCICFRAGTSEDGLFSPMVIIFYIVFTEIVFSRTVILSALFATDPILWRTSTTPVIRLS